MCGGGGTAAYLQLKKFHNILVSFQLSLAMTGNDFFETSVPTNSLTNARAAGLQVSCRLEKIFLRRRKQLPILLFDSLLNGHLPK